MTASPLTETARGNGQVTTGQSFKNSPQDTDSIDRFNHENQVVSNLTLSTIRKEFPAYAATLGAVHASGSKRWRMICPLPEHGDRNPSFTIFESRYGGYLAKCSCGFAGDVVKLAQALEPGLKFRAAVDQIAQAIGIEIELEADTPERRAERKQVAKHKDK